MAKEKYEDLVFQLGDLARELLPNKPTCPRSMERVYKAEDVVVARREDLAGLEQQMNDEDAAYQEYLDALAVEQEEQRDIVQKYKRAVDAIQGRVKDLRKKIGSQKSTVRYEKEGIKKMEKRHADLEMTTTDPRKVQLSKDLLKKQRLATMRKERDLEELQAEFDRVLTPVEGQPGAPGILAHKRLLVLEDEAEERRLEHEEIMADLDQQIGAKEEEVRAAEEFLDQAVFMLGEDCYTHRIADPGLATLYVRLDKSH
jgi:hypothetical protein